MECVLLLLPVRVKTGVPALDFELGGRAGPTIEQRPIHIATVIGPHESHSVAFDTRSVGVLQKVV